MNSIDLSVNVRIENVGFVRADRLREGEMVVIDDRVGILSGAEFEHEGRVMKIRLHFRFFGSYGDEYDGPDDNQFLVDRDAYFPCVEVVVC